MTIWDLVHPDFRDFVRARAQARFRGESVPSRSELKIIAKDGETRWLDVTANSFSIKARPALLGTAFDITDREKAGFEIQRSLLLGQETERKRIARELHDDISQRLALVGLTLSEVEKLSPAASSALDGKLKALRQHVNSIAHDIHRISHNLHPSTLVDLGLVSALRGLCREFADQRTSRSTSPATSPRRRRRRKWRSRCIASRRSVWRMWPCTAAAAKRGSRLSNAPARCT